MNSPIKAESERFKGPKFPLGQVVATSGAALILVHEDILVALGRHAAGDWGELGEEDRAANEAALLDAGRLVSIYHSVSGIKFYIITEHDRSVTTVLLPEEY